MLISKVLIGLLRLQSKLPDILQKLLVRIISWLGWNLNPGKRRNVILTNLEICFGKKNEINQQVWSEQQRCQTAKDNYLHMVRGYFFMANCWWKKPGWLDNNITVNNGEAFIELAKKHFAEQKPIFLIGYHNLYIETIAIAVTRLLKLPMLATYRKHPNQAWENASIAGRLTNLTEVISNKETGKLLRYIKKNPMIVWISVDQNTRKSKVFVPFFGKTAATSIAIARMANVFQAPMVSYSIKRHQDNKFNVHLATDNIIPPSADLHMQAKKINSQIAEHIMLAPEQYLWAHKRFKTQPKGVAKPY